MREKVIYATYEGIDFCLTSDVSGRSLAYLNPEGDYEEICGKDPTHVINKANWVSSDKALQQQDEELKKEKVKLIARFEEDVEKLFKRKQALKEQLEQSASDEGPSPKKQRM